LDIHFIVGTSCERAALLTEKNAATRHHELRKMPLQAYQTSQFVMPCGGIFLGKWSSSLAGSSDGKMNVQSACALYVL
jgi:hypothetical protein